MFKRNRPAKKSSSGKRQIAGFRRRLGFESLEPRLVLSASTAIVLGQEVRNKGVRNQYWIWFLTPLFRPNARNVVGNAGEVGYLEMRWQVGICAGSSAR